MFPKLRGKKLFTVKFDQINQLSLYSGLRTQLCLADGGPVYEGDEIPWKGKLKYKKNEFR